MINEKMKLTGALTIALNGKVVQETHNMVVTVGKNWVAQMMDDNEIAMGWMAVGTGTAAAALTDTQLVTEHADSRPVVSTSVVNNVITYVATWPAGSGTSVSPPLAEAGIFNSSARLDGDMLARTVFNGTIAKDVSDVLTITWAITVS